MPFKPGQSGNPQGGALPKAQKKRLISELLGPHVKDAVQEIVAQLHAKEPGDRQWAVKMVVEYSFGKPSQLVEVSGEEGGPLVAVIREVIKK